MLDAGAQAGGASSQEITLTEILALDAVAAGKLRSARLILRPVCDSDSGALAELLHRDEVRRYLLDDQIVSADWISTQIEASRARFAAGTLGLFRADLAGSKGGKVPEQPIGIVGGIVATANAAPELIYALDPSRWGQGFAAEMARAVIKHAFIDLQWRHVRATVDVPNVRSVRVLEKLAFIREPITIGERLQFVLTAS